MSDSIDLDLIPQQIGNGIIKYDDGSLVKCSGAIQVTQLKALHKILKDTVKCTLDDPFKKITVQFDNKNYVMTTDGEFVYTVLVESK